MLYALEREKNNMEKLKKFIKDQLTPTKEEKRLIKKIKEMLKRDTKYSFKDIGEGSLLK